MVHLYFRVLAPIAGMPGTAAGQILCIYLGAEQNAALRTPFRIPEGTLYGLLGNALLDGTLVDITPDPKPAAVSEALRLAVGDSPDPAFPCRSDHAGLARPLTFRRWRRARSPLRSVP